MNNIISVSNHKGGVGKTSSAINLGAGIAKKGYRVLLIDMDPQANCTQGYKIDENLDSNIYSIMVNNAKIKPVKIKKNLDLIPSTLDLSGAELELASEPGREQILKERLDEIKEDYDYIIIDCPPSLGLLTLNAFTASKYVLIPMSPSFFASKGLSKLLGLIEKVKLRINPNLEFLGVFITRVKTNVIVHESIKEKVNTMLPNKTFKTVIRENITIEESQLEGCDVIDYAKKSNGAKDYKKLVKEILEII